jgi:hypothetical protein
MSPKLACRSTVLDSISGTICCGVALTILAVAALHFLASSGG